MPPNNKFTGQWLVKSIAVSLSCGCHIAGASPQSVDEAETKTLDEIVVVAHKSARSIREIAANVTVVTREDISDMLGTSVADVFRYSPGIDYEASGSRFGAEASGDCHADRKIQCLQYVERYLLIPNNAQGKAR